MSMRIPTLFLIVLGLAACGSDPVKPEPVAGEGKRIEGVSLSPGIADLAKKEGNVELLKDERVKCEKYKPLGSNRTQYRCTTLAEEAKSKEDNNAAMRKIQTPPPSAGARTIGN
jgi:hypothetical protein